MVSVDSTVARAHQDAAGIAVSGEVLDALEAALTEEKRGSVGRAGEFSVPGGADAAGPDPGAEEGHPAREERRRARRRRRVRARAAELGRSKGALSKGNCSYLRARGIKGVIPIKARAYAARSSGSAA